MTNTSQAATLYADSMFILKHFDTPLIKFSVAPITENSAVSIHWVNEAKKTFLPLDMHLTPEGISTWIKHRVIQKNRAYATTLLSRCGLSINRPMDIISVSKGLSLSDSYWIVEDGFEGRYADYNLHDNKFDNKLASIALTGEGTYTSNIPPLSPEYTTDGTLPKCWLRDHGKIKLYKGCSINGNKTRYEAYSEYYVSQIAMTLEIHAVDYHLSSWLGSICSTCEAFTSNETSFISTGRLINKGDFDKVAELYQQKPSFRKAFADMLLLDALTLNTDRHLGNFGFLINSKSNTIKAPAPLFDHGSTLFSSAPASTFTSFNALQNYAATLKPSLYDDFVNTAKQFLDKKTKALLPNLLDFKFKKHNRYNLPEQRQKLIETFLHEQVKKFI